MKGATRHPARVIPRKARVAEPSPVVDARTGQAVSGVIVRVLHYCFMRDNLVDMNNRFYIAGKWARCGALSGPEQQLG